MTSKGHAGHQSLSVSSCMCARERVGYGQIYGWLTVRRWVSTCMSCNQRETDRDKEDTAWPTAQRRDKVWPYIKTTPMEGGPWNVMLNWTFYQKKRATHCSCGKLLFSLTEGLLLFIRTILFSWDRHNGHIYGVYLGYINVYYMYI